MTQDDATAALEDVRVALKEARGVALDHDEEEADLMFERAIETLDHALSGYSLVPTEEIERLRRIEAAAGDAIDIIEDVDNRAMAADGPVTPTRIEMTDEEFRQLYRDLRAALAGGTE